MCFQAKISMSMAGTGNHFVYNMAALANLGATNGLCIPGHSDSCDLYLLADDFIIMVVT